MGNWVNNNQFQAGSLTLSGRYCTQIAIYLKPILNNQPSGTGPGHSQFGSMRVQFIKGFTPPSFLMLFIPELFGPVLECLTLDCRPAQDCPFSASFDLLLDGFSCPKQIHLYLNSHLKGPQDLLVAVHAPRPLTYLPRGAAQKSPKFLPFTRLALWGGDAVHIFRLLLPEHSLCRPAAFAEFCWLKLGRKSSAGHKVNLHGICSSTATTVSSCLTPNV